ncbi:hypothetical protein PRIPAC_85176, partial [Pristionchus pacificus]|uniref:Ribosomal protein n=1 Tax=Pristionchus pacificus TaxID=54126 RepID=A0A2A6BKL8_PRIPA
VKVPEWSDLVKLGVTKDMAPGRKDFDRIASGSVIRKALKSLEALKWVDKSEDGKSRILSKQGRKDLDRIAADLRSTVAPTDAVVFFVEFALCAELRARMHVSTTSATQLHRNSIAKKHTSSY